MNYCPNCGNKIEPGQKFCSNCGGGLVGRGTEKPRSKKPKNLKLITIISIVVALVVIIAAVVSSVLFLLNSDTLVTFPDANLNQAIRDAISKPTGDIYESDLRNLTSFSPSSSNIYDLTGIEYCTGLIGLLISQNHINDISPLSGLTKLQDLDLGSNNIHSISALSGLTDLQNLWLDNNPINDISALSGLTDLQLLYLGYSNTGDSFGTYISDISALANLTNLNILHLVSINVSDISPLVANTGLSSGDEISLGDNPLSAASLNAYIPTLEGRGVIVYR